MKTGLRRSVVVPQRSLSSARSDIITGAVTLAAISIFVASGSIALPKAFQAIAGSGGGADKRLVVALLLNIALILFGWRRCHELKKEVKARSEAELEAQSLAYRDYTTGLHNRRSLMQVAAEKCGASADPAALLVMDLDHFKRVNDVHGHAAGDRLLREVADLIKRSVPDDSCCARLGGDEFAVLLFGEAAATENSERTARMILENLAEPFADGGNLAHVGASIGLSLMFSAEELDASLQRSDVAMYEAKKMGRNCFAWFDTSMEYTLRRRNRLEAEVRVGVAEGQFIPFFQPQIDLITGDLQGFEVLARWAHPEQGIIEPSEFLAIAEASGLISDLSLSVMRQAMIEAACWQSPLKIAVNVSPVQLKDRLLAQRVTKLILETGFPPHRLELEITEGALLGNFELAVATIESLKNLGVRISLEDFGMGYASLTRLDSLPFNGIKIDRTFVLGMAENKESAAIVAAIANFAASLSVPVTAEGIETEANRTNLRLLGCSGGQGWLIGEPLPAEKLAHVVQRPGSASPAGQPNSAAA